MKKVGYLLICILILSCLVIYPIYAITIDSSAQHIDNGTIFNNNVAFSPDKTFFYIVENNSYINEYWANNLTFKSNFLDLSNVGTICIYNNDCSSVESCSISFNIKSIAINSNLNEIYVFGDSYDYKTIRIYDSEKTLIDSFNIGSSRFCDGSSDNIRYLGYSSTINKLLINPNDNNVYGIGYYQNTSGSNKQNVVFHFNSNLNLLNVSYKNYALQSTSNILDAYFDFNNNYIYACGDYSFNENDYASYERFNTNSLTFDNGFSFDVYDSYCVKLILNNGVLYSSDLTPYNNGISLWNIIFNNNFDTASIKQITNNSVGLANYQNNSLFFVGTSEFYNWGTAIYSSDSSLFNNYVINPIETDYSVSTILFDNNNFYLFGGCGLGIGGCYGERFDKIYFNNISIIPIIPTNTSNNSNNSNLNQQPSTSSSFILDLGNYFSSIFPSSNSLSLTQKFSFVFVSMLLVSLLIYFLAWKSTSKIGGIVHYIVLIVNIMLFFLFTALGYIPIGIIIIVVLILLIIGYFRVRSGVN